MYESDDEMLLTAPAVNDAWEIPEPLEYWTLEDFPEMQAY